MNQFSDSRQMMSMGMGTMATNASFQKNSSITDNEKQHYEEKIQILEKKLAKINEGKVDNAEVILELTMENKKLGKENIELSKKERDLKERLTEVENLNSEILVDDSAKDDIIK